ncbi:MAG: response regulator, partial [Bacteroidetes bacterium]|nr:response regulator [Bacteroidota bacterium]
IGIDNALSRLTFVQGDEKIMQEIRLHLASAAKEVSIDLDNSSRNQGELFEAVRAAVMNPGVPGQESASVRIRSFETSALAELRVDQATFDLLKDLFSNFVLVSGVTDCEVLVMTALPGPGDAAEGKGKRVSIRLKAREGDVPGGEGIRGSASMRTMAEKLEKLGYGMDANVLGNEMSLDVFEIRAVEAAGENVLSAILVEDDKKLVEEESQSLLQVFSRLKVAGDAVEAARISEGEKFKVAFIDLSLPSINGRELCRQIKKTQPGCVTVLLTNREGEEKSDGVDHIALRPLDEDAIRSYIRE